MCLFLASVYVCVCVYVFVFGVCVCVCVCVYVCVCVCVFMCLSVCLAFGNARETDRFVCISRILKIIGLFCRIQSLLQGSFAKETHNF